MSAYNATMLDENGNEVYPKSLAQNIYDGSDRLDLLLEDTIFKGTGSSTPSVSDPELRQSDISTVQSTSNVTVPSSGLVKGMNDNISGISGATTWVAGTSYAVGDHILYNGVEYRCIAANSSSTVPSSRVGTYWSVASVATVNNGLAALNAMRFARIFVVGSMKVLLKTGSTIECNCLLTTMNWFDTQRSLTYLRISSQPTYLKTVLAGADIFSYERLSNGIKVTNTVSYSGTPSTLVIDLYGNITSVEATS